MTQPPESTPGQPTNRPPRGSGPYGRQPQQPAYGQPAQHPDPYAGPYGQQPQQYGAQPQSGASSGWGGAQQASPSARAPQDAGRSRLARFASVIALLGALLALAHAIWSLIARRGGLVDAENSADYSAGDLDTNDLITNITAWAAVVVALVALLLWIASIVAARRGAGGLGIAGLVLFFVGAAVAGFGSFSAYAAERDGSAGEAADRYVVNGIGFVLVALGLLLGAIALRKAPRAGRSGGGTPSTSPGQPYAQYQAQPYAQQPPGGSGKPGQPGQAGQLGQPGQYGEPPPGPGAAPTYRP